MKRDHDLLRQILVESEAKDEYSIVSVQGIPMSLDEKKRHYHLLLLKDAGLVEFLSDIAKQLYFDKVIWL